MCVDAYPQLTPRCCRRCCIHKYTHTYIHACKHAYIPWTGQDQSPRRCPGYILASGSTLALLPRLRDLAQRCSSGRGCGAVEAAEEAATAAPRGSGHRSYPFREHGAAPGPAMIDRSATRGCRPQALGGTLLQRPQRMHLDGDGYAALRPQKTLDVVVLRRHIVPAASTWPLLLFRRPASPSPESWSLLVPGQPPCSLLLELRRHVCARFFALFVVVEL